MPATFFEPTDIIPVQSVPILIYAGPGAGKTTLLQTGDRPITLDFDVGIHRAEIRKRAVRFDTWEDVVKEQEKGLFAQHGLIGLDTLGGLLDLMTRSVMEESEKNRMRGGLSISGWGILGSRFGIWIRSVLAAGHQVCAICHEDEDKDVNGKPFRKPALPGKMAWAVVHRSFDLIGHIELDGKKRFIDFSPTDTAVGKNMANWPPREYPWLDASSRFLADLLVEAKNKAGLTAAQSAEIAKVVDDWSTFAHRDGLPIEAMNERFAAEAMSLQGPAKRQVWAILLAVAEARAWTFDKDKKVWVGPPMIEHEEPPRAASEGPAKIEGNGHTEVPVESASKKKRGKVKEEQS